MNPGQTPAIEFRNVSIGFDDAQALWNVPAFLLSYSAVVSDGHVSIHAGPDRQ
jgi:hypothetical protein